MSPAVEGARVEPRCGQLSLAPAAAQQVELRLGGQGRQLEQREGQLGPQAGPNVGRKTLVVDLDETLVHSSFIDHGSSNLIVHVEIEGEVHPVYVGKRPGVDEFLEKMTQLYEVVVYTAATSKYANAVLDELDPYGMLAFRLFREACTPSPFGYVKDLSKLGRELSNIIIIDNSPVCYSLQPENAIPIQTWRSNPSDTELLDLMPILWALSTVENIPDIIRHALLGVKGDECEGTPAKGTVTRSSIRC